MSKVFFWGLALVLCVGCINAGMYPHGYHGGFKMLGGPMNNLGFQGSTMHNFYPMDNFFHQGNIGSYEYFQYNPMWNPGLPGGNVWNQMGGGMNWNQQHMNGWNPGMQMNGNFGANNGFNPNWNTGFNNGFVPNLNTGFNPNLNAGFSPNWNNGFNNGFGPNLNTGFNNGFAPNWNTGFNNGINSNWNTGFNNGFNPNWNTGFNNGFNPNWNTGWNTAGGIAPMQSH